MSGSGVGQFTHLLVPTDGSALSHRAAQRAVAIAADMRARVTFFHALPQPRQSFFSGEGGGFVDQMPPEEFERACEETAARCLGELQALAAAAQVVSDTVIASAVAPFEGIIEAATARGCDLIVMASHGRRGLKGLILGSQTHKVLTHSTLPVLVYR